jgi:hypothetical protein
MSERELEKTNLLSRMKDKLKVLLRRLQAIRSIVFVEMVFFYFAFFSRYIRARVTYYIPKVAPGVALQTGEIRFPKKFLGPEPDK